MCSGSAGRTLRLAAWLVSSHAGSSAASIEGLLLLLLLLLGSAAGNWREEALAARGGGGSLQLVGSPANLSILQIRFLLSSMII